jgi:ATP-dependent Clp protease ATP-binding subunit ClpX
MKAGSTREDVGNIIPRLLQAADHEIEKAEGPLISVHEIDNIRGKTENILISHDVSGECVHQAVLQILEEMSFNVSPRGGRKHRQQE